VPVIRMCRSPRIAPPAPCSRLGRGRCSAELMTKPAATLLFRLTGADIEQCPACHAGRLRVLAVFAPGQCPVLALDTS